MKDKPATKVRGLNSLILIKASAMTHEDGWGHAAQDYPPFNIKTGDAVMFLQGDYYSFSVDDSTYIAVDVSRLIAVVQEESS